MTDLDELLAAEPIDLPAEPDMRPSLRQAAERLLVRSRAVNIARTRIYIVERRDWLALAKAVEADDE